MYLFFAIFVFLVFTQILMGIFASSVKRSLKRKYSYYLGEQIEFNKILETYQQKHSNLNILASDEIDDVCIAENNLIIISKKSIYAKDLYSNLVLLFQLKLTNPKLREIRNIYSYQSVVFLSQILCLILFFVLPTIQTIILAAGYLVLLLNIFLVIYGIWAYSKILSQVLIEAKPLLKLDLVELARAETLANEIKYEVLTYPLEIPWRLTRFWSL